VNANTSRLRPSGRRIRQRSQSRSLRSLFSFCAATCAACGGLNLIISGPPLHRISVLVHLPLTDVVANLIGRLNKQPNHEARATNGSPEVACVGTNGENHPFPKRCSNDHLLPAPALARRVLGPVDLRLGAWTLYSAFMWSTSSHLSQIYAMMRSPRSWTQRASEATLPCIIARRP
jgi:hypothetical protein